MSKRGYLNNPVYQAGYRPPINVQPEKILVIQKLSIILTKEVKLIIIDKLNELSLLINLLTQLNIKLSTELTIQPEKVILPVKLTITKKPKKRGDNKGAK